MLYPMALMILLTFIVGLIAVNVRFASVRSGDVSIRYYKLMQGQEVPDTVIKTTRCFNNMFEIPVLFYVACTLYISLGIESLLGLVFAWLFVAIRHMHVYIHLTYNNILHRMAAFWVGFVCVLVLWTNLLVQKI